MECGSETDTIVERYTEKKYLFPLDAIVNAHPREILKGAVHYSPQSEMTRSISCFFIIIIKVVFKSKEGDGGGGGTNL